VVVATANDPAGHPALAQEHPFGGQRRSNGEKHPSGESHVIGEAARFAGALSRSEAAGRANPLGARLATTHPRGCDLFEHSPGNADSMGRCGHRWRRSERSTDAAGSSYHATVRYAGDAASAGRARRDPFAATVGRQREFDSTAREPVGCAR
jgi:hypothetical protein